MPPDDRLRALITGDWQIERAASDPAYAQIERRITTLIEAGALVAGDRLPGERDLADWVGVSRMTARAALGALADRGAVARGVGRGTFVAPPRVERDLTDFAGFTDMVRRQGLSPTARVLRAAERPAPEEVATSLGLDAGAPVLRIERVRFADDAPVTLEDSWLPAARFPGLLRRELRGSLYALMGDDFGRAPVRAVERLSPVIATPVQAQTLGVPGGTPLMLVERLAYDAEDVPVELARDHHRGDRARFVAHTAVGTAP